MRSMKKMQFINFHGKVQLPYRLDPPFRAFTSLRQAGWKLNYIYPFGCPVNMITEQGKLVYNKYFIVFIVLYLLFSKIASQGKPLCQTNTFSWAMSIWHYQSFKNFHWQPIPFLLKQASFKCIYILVKS